MILTLTKSKKQLNLNTAHIVAWQESDDPAKPNVTVVYTSWATYPFEVDESATTIANYMPPSMRNNIVGPLTRK